jgi:hypothetical protein
MNASCSNPPQQTVSLVVKSDQQSFNFNRIVIHLLYQQNELPLSLKIDSLPDVVYAAWENREMEPYCGKQLTIKLFADSSIIFTDTFTCIENTSRIFSFNFWINPPYYFEDYEKIPLNPLVFGIYDTLFVFNEILYPQPN